MFASFTKNYIYTKALCAVHFHIWLLGELYDSGEFCDDTIMKFGEKHAKKMKILLKKSKKKSRENSRMQVDYPLQKF